MFCVKLGDKSSEVEYQHTSETYFSFRFSASSVLGAFELYDVLQGSKWASIFQYFGWIRYNIFIFLKGSLIMRNFNFGVAMRLVFLMPMLMNIPGLLENATVTTRRETPLFVA